MYNCSCIQTTEYIYVTAVFHHTCHSSIGYICCRAASVPVSEYEIHAREIHLQSINDADNDCRLCKTVKLDIYIIVSFGWYQKEKSLSIGARQIYDMNIYCF
jgi:hypothetical protein